MARAVFCPLLADFLAGVKRFDKFALLLLYYPSQLLSFRRTLRRWEVAILQRWGYPMHASVKEMGAIVVSPRIILARDSRGVLRRSRQRARRSVKCAGLFEGRAPLPLLAGSPAGTQ